MAIIQFHDVYVTSRSAVGGPVEAKGPLAEQFDKCHEDTYCGEDCFDEKRSSKFLIWMCW